jgi:hypothetical protein
MAIEAASLDILVPAAPPGKLAHVTILCEPGQSIHKLKYSLFLVHPCQFNDIGEAQKLWAGFPRRHAASIPRVIIMQETIMSYPTKARCAATRRGVTTLLLLTLALPLASVTAHGQQSYVSRYNLYGGYTFLDSPHVSLFENGFHFQAGVNPKTWCALGFDYSVSEGSLTLTPNLLTAAWQAQLGGLLQQLAAAGQLPAGYTVTVPSDSFTQTFAGGPQLSYRHFSKVTIFVRPSIGVIHEVATPQPADAIAKIIVAALAPTGKKTDSTLFYGFGGGADFLLTKHIGVRVQADLVYDHLFSDTLQDGRFTTRFSIGPCFSLGKNIAKRNPKQ